MSEEKKNETPVEETTQTSSSHPEDEKPSTTKNAEFDPEKIKEHVKRLTHKLPKDHQPYKVIVSSY